MANPSKIVVEEHSVPISGFNIQLKMDKILLTVIAGIFFFIFHLIRNFGKTNLMQQRILNWSLVLTGYITMLSILKLNDPVHFELFSELINVLFCIIWFIIAFIIYYSLKKFISLGKSENESSSEKSEVANLKKRRKTRKLKISNLENKAIIKKHIFMVIIHVSLLITFSLFVDSYIEFVEKILLFKPTDFLFPGNHTIFMGTSSFSRPTNESFVGNYTKLPELSSIFRPLDYISERDTFAFLSSIALFVCSIFSTFITEIK